MKKIDPTYEGMYAIETLAKSTFVKLSESATKVWMVVGWCKCNKAYELTDAEDMNNCKYVKKGKKVFAGFEY